MGPKEDFDMRNKIDMAKLKKKVAGSFSAIVHHKLDIGDLYIFHKSF